MRERGIERVRARTRVGVGPHAAETGARGAEQRTGSARKTGLTAGPGCQSGRVLRSENGPSGAWSAERGGRRAARLGRAGATGWAAGKKEPLGFAGGNGPEGEEKELGRVGLLGWFEFGLGFLFLFYFFPLFYF